MGSEQSGAEGSYGLLRGSCQRKDMGDSRGSIGMGGPDKRASILGLGTLSHGYPCGVHLEYTIPLDQRYSLVAWTHPGRRLEARRRAFRDTPRSWQTSGDSVCTNSLDLMSIDRLLAHDKWLNTEFWRRSHSSSKEDQTALRMLGSTRPNLQGGSLGWTQDQSRRVQHVSRNQ